MRYYSDHLATRIRYFFLMNLPSVLNRSIKYLNGIVFENITG